MIVPSYNAEATLAEAVQSALDGTYRNLELIIVDDGSTDQTFAAAETLARSDSRVRLHRQPNAGVSAAFNAGLALARGEYVARLDSDDIWHPAKLEKQVGLALQQPEAGFIYTFVRYINANAGVVHDGPDQRFSAHALCRGIYESLAGSNSSGLMRRSLVNEIGGYDPGLTSWEDLLLQLQISARAEIACVPEYLVGYRVRAGSLSSHPTNMLRSWREVRRKIAREFPQVPGFVGRWAHGRRCGSFAESFAWKGEYHMSARLLAEALATDCRWTIAFLAARSSQRLRRRLGGCQRVRPAISFAQCNPLTRILPEESEGRRSPLRSLEAKRVAKLIEIDDALARGR